MTQREKFFETVGILVEAYLNGTLLHGDCAACAVGNIIAAKLKCKIVPGINSFGDNINWWQRGEHEIKPLWPLVFVTDSHSNQIRSPKSYMGHTKLQIDATGYSWQQLALIESAFERAAHTSCEGEEQAMFDGLMAVTNVLAEIHGINLEERESAKLLFNKASV